MDNIIIKPEYLDILINIFDKYCSNAEIWAYGSRVNGDAHSGSDLDITVRDFHAPDKNIYELREIIRESNIPFIVDINLFDNLPDSFKSEIERNYVVIYKK